MFKLLKIIFIVSFLFLLVKVGAQIVPGFNAYEAIDMIKICNSYTFQDLYNSDDDIIPEEYQRYYASDIFGMDNRYQIFLKDSIAILCFRGSTANKISWLENMNASMIPAQGIIKTEADEFHYKLARDKNAAVHAGYTHAMAYFYKDVLNQVRNLNKLGYYSFITTGHSQGGALSNVLRAYLENLPDSFISPKCRFKTYAFAAPMTGNESFVIEYNARYCNNQTSFNIVNPKDGIPKLPASFSDSIEFIDNCIQFLDDPTKIDYGDVVMNVAYKVFSKGVIYYTQRISESAKNEIIEELGNFVLPEYVNDFDYVYLANKIEIDAFEYPKVLKDSSLLVTASEISNIEDTEANKDLYMEESFGFQHKPYNYYVYLLKEFFLDEYNRLEKKYLVENL